MILICLIIGFCVGVAYWFFALFIPAFIVAWNEEEKPIQADTSLENNQSILDELEHLKAQKAGYMSLSATLEKQLETATTKQTISIKRQLLALDNKTFTLDRKIIKLLEKLE